MIVLTSYAKQGLAPGAKVRIPYDKIHMLQRQDPADGKQFTAVFILGFPPYAVEETPEQIDAIIDEELKRLHMLKRAWYEPTMILPREISETLGKNKP